MNINKTISIEMGSTSIKINDFRNFSTDFTEIRHKTLPFLRVEEIRELELTQL